MINNNEANVINSNYWKDIKSTLELAGKYPWVTTLVTVSSLIGLGLFAYSYRDNLLKNGLHFTLPNGKVVGVGPAPTVGFFSKDANKGEVHIEGSVDIKSIPGGNSAFDHGTGDITTIKGPISIGGGPST